MEKNNLVFSGVVGFISERTTGESKKGNAYQKGYFIVGEPDVKYPNEMKFEWYREGESKQLDGLQLGHEVEVSYSCEAKEYNGKHYQGMQMRSIKNLSAPTADDVQNAPAGENKYSALKNPAVTTEAPKENIPF